MNSKNEKIKITIDNKLFEVNQGLTILQAAEQNNIYIPTLCAHKHLSPHGGCRMCLVEVEDARGFLTACTTPIEDGMIIRTHTDQIQKERWEIMELILSEHTSSCLICDEKEECKASMSTIRKVGVTTGCRYCPNDNDCELEKVVSWLGISEIHHPVYYRGLRVEKEDPFYDRDYNLCILCGRCVRICQEVRNANVLAFNQRGRNTVIGPAFNRAHLEAGCEFCGDCVSVCPTGALYEKANKWDGNADRETITTCALCGVGCQMRVLAKNEKVIGTLPAEDGLVNNGHLCVKGRFCVNELVNNYQRLQKPSVIKEGAQLAVSWDEAIDVIAERLKNCTPEEFAMLISPNCTNEDLYIAQKFTRTVMKSNNIDSSARSFYGSAFNAYIDLFKNAVPLSEIDNADLILALNLDLRYGRSVVGVKIRQAINRGAKIATIHPHEHSLSINADSWIQVNIDEESNIIETLIGFVENNGTNISHNSELRKLTELLTSASHPVILTGTEFFGSSQTAKIMTSIGKLTQILNAGVIPLPAQNNLVGSLFMGAYPELMPGAKTVTQKAGASSLKKFKVAYFVGELPPDTKRIADFIIYQNIYPLEQPEAADISLPAASFTEIDGSFINGEGRLQQIKKATKPVGEALPDWQILCRIAEKMGQTEFRFKNVAEIQAEIAKESADLKDFNNITRQLYNIPENIQLNKNNRVSATKNAPYDLPAELEHIFRGIPLTTKVDGLKKLFS